MIAKKEYSKICLLLGEMGKMKQQYDYIEIPIKIDTRRELRVRKGMRTYNEYIRYLMELEECLRRDLKI